jgi:hypothetical protein
MFCDGDSFTGSNGSNTNPIKERHTNDTINVNDEDFTEELTN